MWLSGRASPCQGEGREFESRHPLHYITRYPEQSMFGMVIFYYAGVAQW